MALQASCWSREAPIMYQYKKNVLFIDQVCTHWNRIQWFNGLHRYSALVLKLEIRTVLLILECKRCIS